MSAPAIAVEDLQVHFRGVAALGGVTLALNAGERRALIGPNGAGKTTLFNVLDGHVKPSHGRIFLFGDEAKHVSTHTRARRGLSRTYQITNLLNELSVRDNVMLGVAATERAQRLTFWRALDGLPGIAARAEELLRQWELWHLRDRPVAQLAYGQQRVLEIVLALSSDPKILLLDEPTAGLSTHEAGMLTEVATSLPASLALLVIEHDMDVAFRLGDIVSVLADGMIIAEGPPEQIRSSPIVIETYLGEHGDAA